MVGSAIVEILLGKGIGKAGSILAKTKTGAEIIEKAKLVKSATVAKIAETLSDEAAAIASRKVKQRLATQLYAGIPADVLANMAIVAGNKLKNGAVKFTYFKKQMISEIGEKVEPYLEKLYREKMTELGLADKIDEVGIKATKSLQLQKVEHWEKTGKIKGDLKRLKSDLISSDNGARIGAEAEVQELERKIARGEVPEVRGTTPGTDQPEYEVKARTEPFIDLKNAQNFFNDRIKKANIQFISEKTKGQVIINLGKEIRVGDILITKEMTKDFVKNALSKGGRGTNITEVVVKSSDGTIIYKGLGN